MNKEMTAMNNDTLAERERTECFPYPHPPQYWIMMLSTLVPTLRDVIVRNCRDRRFKIVSRKRAQDPKTFYFFFHMNSPSSAKQPSNDKGGGGQDGGGGGGGEGCTNNEDVDILRKEYRNMQANRNAFAHESELVLRRQQATLDKLREENKTLKDNVARIQTRHMTRPINNFEQSQLDRLYQELDQYSSLVESEKAKAAATENEITKLREDIWTRRQEMGGVNAAANNQRVVEKQVRLLESQLDQALVKFNKCVSRNKRLREEIDGLRGERVTFEKVYRKVEMVSPILRFPHIEPRRISCPNSFSSFVVTGLKR